MGLLKASGVQFSVDDFGTGYSSLAYLTRLPLDQLKIDQSFVRNLGVRHSDGQIVQTIIVMARSLGLEVIAEGVETQEQRELLAQYGCERYQGYLLARPAPAAALEAIAHQRREDSTMPDTSKANASA
jgi:EAL domain-containing protein (putative c-di-GMP-specific phosphodiesterase class I)